MLAQTSHSNSQEINSIFSFFLFVFFEPKNNILGQERYICGMWCVLQMNVDNLLHCVFTIDSGTDNSTCPLGKKKKKKKGEALSCSLA